MPSIFYDCCLRLGEMPLCRALAVTCQRRRYALSQNASLFYASTGTGFPEPRQSFALLTTLTTQVIIIIEIAQTVNNVKTVNSMNSISSLGLLYVTVRMNRI